MTNAERIARFNRLNVAIDGALSTVQEALEEEYGDEWHAINISEWGYSIIDELVESVPAIGADWDASLEV